MGLGLFLAFALAVGATLFVIISSVVLVIHKALRARSDAKKRQLYAEYSHLVAEVILRDLPPLPEESKAGAIFDQYEEILRPIKERLESVRRTKRTLHRQALKEALIDFAKDIRGETSDRLTYFFSSLGYVDEGIELLRSAHWWIRAQAAHDLRYFGARGALAPLTVALEDRHADVRIQAMQSLVVLGGVQSISTILRTSKNISQWTAIELSIIIMRYKDEAVPFLVEALNVSDQSIVLFCIEMLAEIGFVSAVEPLRSMASEYPNVVIRAKAVEALGRLGDGRAEGLLLELLRNPFPILRLKSVEALGRIGTPSAIASLTERLRDGDFQEKLLAARSIAQIGHEGISYLKALTGVENRLVCDISSQVLEEFGEESTTA
jgi:HEAT repeat protein